MKIGLAIAKRREQLGLTQEEVALYVGVSKASVSRWESGDISNMRRDRIQKLSEILKVSPVQLISDETEGLTDTQPEDIKLDNAYLSFAKDAQDQGIDPDDIRLALETIKSMRRRRKEQEGGAY